jgi:choline dehydrogenase-like flavoprotein
MVVAGWKARWAAVIEVGLGGRWDATNVVDADAQSWDVKRLYVGDGSLIPRTLSVNPSLTIMALASRLADHLHSDPHGYLS